MPSLAGPASCPGTRCAATSRACSSATRSRARSRHAEIAEPLAERSLHPRALPVAAGLGRGALADELAGTPAAGAHRAFYRPHSGFPRWQPSDDPGEILDESLSWAARNDRAGV